MPEGPVFMPKVKGIPVSESPEDRSPLSDVIATYPAFDGDTLEPAEKVRYLKGLDPDNWLSVNPETAELRLNKVPDRVSFPGTIALQVGDANDNCPELTSTLEYLCTDAKMVNITAEDTDDDPNAAPYEFMLVEEETQREWKVEPISDTSASLRTLKPLWPGAYDLKLQIQDQQGFCLRPRDGKAQTLTGTLTTVGMPGIGIIILGFLVLPFVALLLISCTCGGVGGTFTDLPFNTKGHLTSYHTEGRGEDREVPLLRAPVRVSKGAIAAGTMATNVDYSMAAGAGTREFQESAFGSMYYDCNDMVEADQREHMDMHSESMDGFRVDYEGIALPDHYLDGYYSQKAHYAAENYVQKDSILVCDYEGQGSPVGSVGCCSLLESDNDLQFLNDLGPKFKTLAEICSPPKPISSPPKPKVDPIVDSPASPPRPNINIKREIPVATSNVNLTQSSLSNVNINQSSTSNVNINQSSSSSVNITQSALTRPVSNVTHVNHSPPSQTFLLQQQPVYYTTMQPMMQPMMQQMHYVVEQQVPNMQGMIMVNGTPSGGMLTGHSEHNTHGVGLHNGTFTLPQTTLGRGERMVHVEENQGGGQRLVTSGPGQATLGRGENMVLVGGGGGGLSQGVLLGGGAGLNHFHGSIGGTLSGHQKIMLSSEQ
ncbi:unnamed protein product, partial [Coregonus sp. 'balchen']